ncbi:MAG: UDP-N-acetylmuramate--L-alanine ligase [Bacillota bacterium]
MDNNQQIHLVGIGGIGMSGIANLLLDLGYQVSGSDLKESELILNLRNRGAKISIGHHGSNVIGADKVVYSSAIPKSNPELVKARQLTIPILKRAEMVGELMSRQQGIAIAGTHGKTTTTAMVATILEANQLDPTILVGGELDLIDGNAKLGSGDYFVTEADESDGSLLFMEPEIGVVTNIENDHLDYYKTEEQILDTFTEFLNQIPTSGCGVLCIDDSKVAALAEDLAVTNLTYGFNQQAEIVARDIKLEQFGVQATIYQVDNRLGNLKLQVPGEYNLHNALAAISIGLYIGLDFTEIASALADFKGVKRRFERKGEYQGAIVVDDYAHHPTELEATLSAAANMDFDRVIAVFQPHRYTRTKLFLEEFSQSFTAADEVIITDIYASGEDPIPGVKAEKIAQLINQRSFNKAKFIATLDGIYNYLYQHVGSGDLVLTLGAGDIWTVGDKLVSQRLKVASKLNEELSVEV